MEVCINPTYPEFRHLKEVSGLPEFTLKAYCRKYLDLKGRYPKLSELPFADSTNYLTKLLEIKQNKSTSRQKILEFTQTNSIEEAIVKLNKDYSDLIIDIKELGSEVIVDIQHRSPVTFKEILDLGDEIDWNHPLIDGEVNSTVFFNRAISGLSRKLGISIKAVTSYDIEHTPELKLAIPNAWSVNGFVHNGTIYVNLDNASVDTPIHELMHIFIGGIRTLDPNLYETLLNSMLLDPDIDYLILKFQDRTRNDALEEILVDMFAHYITEQGDNKNFFNNPEIYDYIDLMIDTVLIPNKSSRTMPMKDKVSMSMKLLGLRLHSAAISGFYEDKYKLDLLTYAKSHLELNNIKRDLIRNGKLLEYCS